RVGLRTLDSSTTSQIYPFFSPSGNLPKVRMQLTERDPTIVLRNTVIHQLTDGWNEVEFESPIEVQAHTIYRLRMQFEPGKYAYFSGTDFGAAGYTQAEFSAYFSIICAPGSEWSDFEIINPLAESGEVGYSSFSGGTCPGVRLIY